MALELGRPGAPGADRVRGRRVVNPITWFDSVIWGQVDSFGTVFLLLGVRELWRGRRERAAILAVVAALVKPQLAILVPIVAIVVIRRALWPAGGYGDEPEPAPARASRWERRPIGAIRILTTGVAGFVTAVAALGAVRAHGARADGRRRRSSSRRCCGSCSARPRPTRTSPSTPTTGGRCSRSTAQSAATAGGALWIPDAPIAGRGLWARSGRCPRGARRRRVLLLVIAVAGRAVGASRGGPTGSRSWSASACSRSRSSPCRPASTSGTCSRSSVSPRSCSRSRGGGAIVYVVAARGDVPEHVRRPRRRSTTTRRSPTGSGIGDALRSPVGRDVRSPCCTRPRSCGASLQLRPGARRTLAAELEAAGRTEAPPGEPEPDPVRRDRAAGGAGPARCAAAAPGAIGGRDHGRRPGGGLPRTGPSAAGVGGAHRGDGAARSAPGLVRPPVVDGARARSRWLRARIDRDAASAPTGQRLLQPRAPRAGSTGSTCSDPRRARRRRAAPPHVPAGRARPGCTSTRSTTPGPPTEFLAGLALRHRPRRSTSGPIPHLAKYAMALRDRGVRRPRRRRDRATSACRSGTRPSSRAARTRPAAATVTGDRCGSRPAPSSSPTTCAPAPSSARWRVPGRVAPSRSTTTALRILIGTDAGEVCALDTHRARPRPRRRPRRRRSSTRTPVATLRRADHAAGARSADGTLAAAVIGDGQVAVVDLDTGEVRGRPGAGRRRRRRSRPATTSTPSSRCRPSSPTRRPRRPARRAARRRRGRVPRRSSTATDADNRSCSTPSSTTTTRATTSRRRSTTASSPGVDDPGGRARSPSPAPTG